MADLDTAQEVDGGIILDDGAGLFQGDFDPSSVGFAAQKGSLFMRNATPGRLYRKTGDDATAWTEVTAGGVSDFLGLTDTPSSYASQGGKFVVVNGGETALEFVAPADIDALQIRRSTTFAITTAFTDISFDLTDLENNIAVLEHDNVNTDRILIQETGLYFVWYKANINSMTSSGNDEVRCQVRLNDTTVLADSLADTTVFNDSSIPGALHDDTVSMPGFLRLFTAGDFLSLQIIKTELGSASDTATEAGEAQFAAFRMKGPRGSKGAPGAPGGATVIIQEEGVNIPNTPHTTINFKGPAVTATDAGSGVADIDITATGGGAGGDLAAVQARRSTNFVPTATYADITLDVTDVENDVPVLEHDDTNTEQILIKEDGPYLISYGATVDLDDASATTEDTFIRVIKNGTTEIPGSEAFVNAESTDDSKPYIHRTVVAELLDGDEISFQARQTSGTTALVADTIVFNIVRLRGTKGATEDYILIRDEKANNTAGGTFTSGALRTRDLNTEVNDAGGHASIASNQITLAAGTYRFQITAPGHSVERHQALLRNITDAISFIGTNADSDGSNQGNSVIAGRFTIAASKVFEVQHECSLTKTTNGFGSSMDFVVVNEIYTQVEFWKET